MTPRRTNPTPPLLDLLGAAWTLDAPVTGVAWDGATAGFALGDGSLATARAGDTDARTSRSDFDSGSWG